MPSRHCQNCWIYLYLRETQRQVSPLVSWGHSDWSTEIFMKTYLHQTKTQRDFQTMWPLVFGMRLSLFSLERQIVQGSNSAFYFEQFLWTQLSRMYDKIWNVKSILYVTTIAEFQGLMTDTCVGFKIEILFLKAESRSWWKFTFI